MIIQCEQCRTKFRLDDSRVKDAGVKVRCAKCKHVFSVRKELPDTLPQPGFAALLDTAAIVYTPTLDFVGTDTFTYTVSDGRFTAVRAPH